jgi:hypothetical protein
VRNCWRAVHVRSPRGRGGVVEKLHVSNMAIHTLEEMAVKVSHYYDSVALEGRFMIKAAANRHNLEIARSRKVAVDEGTPTFRDFVFSGLTMERVREVALVEGLPERYIRGIRFENIAAGHAIAGVSCTLASDVTISNLSVGTLEAPAVDAREVERLEVRSLQCGEPQATTPLIWMDSVNSAFITGCNVGDAGPGFEWLHQDQCKRVVLAANNVPEPKPAGRPPKSGGG